MPLKTTTVLLLVAVVVAAAGSASAAVPAPTDGEDSLRIRLVLQEALPRGDTQEPNEPSIIVGLQRTGDVWERVWATAGNYNRHEHTGRVNAAQVSDKAIELELALTLKGDPWVSGGPLQVAVDLDRKPDGSCVGTYRGTKGEIPIEGNAWAAVLPRPVQYTAAVQGDEHPRLLFRAGDLPALRKRAKTKFGQLALAKMNDSAAGSAFRFAITGDNTLAADARRRVEAMMKDKDNGDKRVRSRWWAWKLEQAAIAYDLCYHAWDEPFRREVAEYLCYTANVLVFRRDLMDSHISWNYGGPHAPTMTWAAGVAALAISGERDPQPVKPRPPHLISESQGAVAALDNLKPGKGVAVVPFASGKMPTEWIYAGAFPVKTEPLATDKLRGAARPAVGQRLGKGDAERAWRKLTRDEMLYRGEYSNNKTVLELTGPSGVVTRTNSYYYLVLENDKSRYARVHTGHGNVAIYLAGVRLSDGDVVRLEPGLYPWLTTGPIGDMKPWGMSFAEPKLIELSEAEVQQAVARTRARYDEQLRTWQQDHAQWQRTGGADVRYLKTAEVAHHVMDMVAAELLGRGGFMSGAANTQAMDGPNKYALMFRNVTGRDAGGHAEWVDYLPRAMFVHPYRGDRQPIGQEINGRPGFVCSDYPESGRDAANENFAPLLPLIRPEWQPTVLWAWQYHTGGSSDDEAAIERILTVKRSGYAFGRDYGSFDTHPIYAFLNYPLDMRPKPPQGPMPLVWQAPDFGFYGFRNNWIGNDSQFTTQFFAATYGEGAGTLRVAGLGQVSSHGIGAPAEGRYGENVVQLSENEINAGAHGKVTYLECGRDGSGVISIDLSDVYSKPVVDEAGHVVSLYERYGDVPHTGAFGPSGITGMRSMGIDYSGRSGVPCLIAVVDRIRGGRQKSWAWQLESKAESAGKSQADSKREGWITFGGRSFNNPRNGQLLYSESRPIEDDDRVELLADGFTLTQADATMRATFVSPAKPRLELAEKAQYRDLPKNGVRRDSSQAIFADGGGEFFVILTFQQGPAPKVEVQSGKGLDARIRVGRQTVSFDGEKIVFGE